MTRQSDQTLALAGDNNRVPMSTFPDAVTRVHEPRVLFIVSSSDKVLKGKGEDKGHKTGTYLSEIAHIFMPLYKRFPKLLIELASPQGGAMPLDESSLEPYKDDSVCQEFLKDDVITGLRFNTKKIEQVKANDYIGIVIPGGHGPMFDLALPEKAHIPQFIAAVYERGGFIASVCHGPASLLNVHLKGEHGVRLIDGKNVTGFSNDEELDVGLTDQVPFLLEDCLKANGGVYSKAEKPWGANVVRDGMLLTGQNPTSAAPLGEALVSVIQSIISKGLQYRPFTDEEKARLLSQVGENPEEVRESVHGPGKKVKHTAIGKHAEE